MPKSSVVANATSVLDIVPIRTVGGLPMTGIGKLANPAAGPTLTTQTVGGTIVAGTNPTVDVAFSYTSTPGANGATNGETLISPIIQSGAMSGSNGSLLCVFPTTWPAAGAINVYVGAHGGTLFLMTGTGYPVPLGQNAIQINSVPTSGTVVPVANTSWSHGFTCTMVHDNDTAATTLAPYVAAANTWINTSPPSLGLFEMGNGTYQLSLPDAAWSKAGAQIATFTISGVAGQGVLTWTTAIGSAGGSVTVGGYGAGQDPATLLLVTPANKLATDASGHTTLAPAGLDLVKGWGTWSARQTLQAIAQFLVGKRSNVPAAGSSGTITYQDNAAVAYGTVTVDTTGDITTSGLTPPA